MKILFYVGGFPRDKDLDLEVLLEVEKRRLHTPALVVEFSEVRRGEFGAVEQGRHEHLEVPVGKVNPHEADTQFQRITARHAQGFLPVRDRERGNLVRSPALDEVLHNLEAVARVTPDDKVSTCGDSGRNDWMIYFLRNGVSCLHP